MCLWIVWQWSPFDTVFSSFSLVHSLFHSGQFSIYSHFFHVERMLPVVSRHILKFNRFRQHTNSRVQYSLLQEVKLAVAMWRKERVHLTFILVIIMMLVLICIRLTVMQRVSRVKLPTYIQSIFSTCSGEIRIIHYYFLMHVELFSCRATSSSPSSIPSYSFILFIQFIFEAFCFIRAHRIFRVLSKEKNGITTIRIPIAHSRSRCFSGSKRLFFQLEKWVQVHVRLHVNK